MSEITKDRIEAEFEGSEAWQGVDRRWHSRISGATPPVMVHHDDLTGLREEIVRKVSPDRGEGLPATRCLNHLDRRKQLRA